MAAYREQKDLIAIGAYEHGSNPVVDRAIMLKDQNDGFLRQRASEPSTVEGADHRAPRARRHGRGERVRRHPGRSRGNAGLAVVDDGWPAPDPAPGDSAIPSFDLAHGVQ